MILIAVISQEFIQNFSEIKCGILSKKYSEVLLKDGDDIYTLRLCPKTKEIIFLSSNSQIILSK